MQKWNAAPVGAWFFDLLENIAIVSLLTVYPSQPAGLAWLAMLFGLLKWAKVGRSYICQFLSSINVRPQA